MAGGQPTVLHAENPGLNLLGKLARLVPHMTFSTSQSPWEWAFIMPRRGLVFFAGPPSFTQVNVHTWLEVMMRKAWQAGSMLGQSLSLPSVPLSPPPPPPNPLPPSASPRTHLAPQVQYPYLAEIHDEEGLAGSQHVGQPVEAGKHCGLHHPVRLEVLSRQVRPGQHRVTPLLQPWHAESAGQLLYIITGTRCEQDGPAQMLHLCLPAVQ